GHRRRPGPDRRRGASHRSRGSDPPATGNEDPGSRRHRRLSEPDVHRRHRVLATLLDTVSSLSPPLVSRDRRYLRSFVRGTRDRLVLDAYKLAGCSRLWISRFLAEGGGDGKERSAPRFRQASWWSRA